MFEETREQRVRELVPAPEVRERVLSACRREMEARVVRERRAQARWRWSMAVATLSLLLLNVAEEHRSAARMDAFRLGPARVAQTPRPAAIARGGLRARLTLLVVLLRDPTAL
jgi:hypothetical protein